jgi:hypothetical protein
MVKPILIDYAEPCYYLGLWLVYLPKIIHQQDVRLEVNVWKKNH